MQAVELTWPILRDWPGAGTVTQLGSGVDRKPTGSTLGEVAEVWHCLEGLAALHGGYIADAWFVSQAGGVGEIDLHKQVFEVLHEVS